MFHLLGQDARPLRTKDDTFSDMLAAYRLSDVVILATRSTSTMSRPMKMFMDRFLPMVDPHFGGRERRIPAAVPATSATRPGIVANSGFPEPEQFQVPVADPPAWNLHPGGAGNLPGRHIDPAGDAGGFAVLKKCAVAAQGRRRVCPNGRVSAETERLLSVRSRRPALREGVNRPGRGVVEEQP